MERLLFDVLIAAHILAGTTGAVAFSVPIIGRKGGETHRKAVSIFDPGDAGHRRGRSA